MAKKNESKLTATDKLYRDIAETLARNAAGQLGGKRSTLKLMTFDRQTASAIPSSFTVAFAAKFSKSRGVTVEPADVLRAAGSKHAADVLYFNAAGGTIQTAEARRADVEAAKLAREAVKATVASMLETDVEV